MMFTTIAILNSRNLNILLPGNGAKTSTGNGAKNKGEQEAKSYHCQDILINKTKNNLMISNAHTVILV